VKSGTGCFAVALVAGSFLVGGCNRDELGAAADDDPRVEIFSRGPVEVALTLDPSRVRLEKDVLLTVRITAPSSVDVEIPRLDERFQGFLLAESFSPEPVEFEGAITKQMVARLTPLLHEEYRIAPIVVEYSDGTTGRAKAQWFSTKPIVMDYVAVSSDRTGNDIQDELEPVWIHPPMRTVGVYALLVAALVCLAFLGWILLKRVHRRIRLMRMSPRERAIEELTDLLKRDLLAKNLVKTFYVELTMVVRRYIERQHAVRAPEQTTEEFLLAVTNDGRFTQKTVMKLRSFLESADLVKFAAYHPQSDAIDTSIDTARAYIETDDAVVGEQQ